MSNFERKILDFEQGSPQWLQARCGILTASEMHNLITPKKKEIVHRFDEKQFFYKKLAERITNTIDDIYINDDMMRGQQDEIVARALYSEHYNPINEVGFITCKSSDLHLGFSPDGIAEDGSKFIEIKSKKRSLHLQVLISQKVPDEHLAQIQTGMFVSGIDHCDFISYCAGLPMVVLPVGRDEEYQNSISAVAIEFENNIRKNVDKYNALCQEKGMINTESVIDADVYLSDIMGGE